MPCKKIKKKRKSHRGQLTFVNIVAIFIAILTLLLLTPVMTNMIDTTIAMLVEGNEYTPLVKTLLYLIIPAMVIATLMTIINYANPPQGYGY